MVITSIIFVTVITIKVVAMNERILLLRKFCNQYGVFGVPGVIYVQYGDLGTRGKWLKHVLQQRENVERYRRETSKGGRERQRQKGRI